MRSSSITPRCTAIAVWILLAGLTAPAAELALRVLDTEGNPLEGAVAWVDGGGGPAPAPLRVEITQKDRQFIPHVTVIPAGSTATFPNRDSVQHHVYSFSPTRKFDIPLYIGESPASIRFDQPGVVTLGCNIHDWMAAYVLVLETARYAASDSAGVLTIPGSFQQSTPLRVWHPRLRGNPVVTGAQPGAVVEVKLPLKPVFRRTPPPAEGGSYR